MDPSRGKLFNWIEYLLPLFTALFYLATEVYRALTGKTHINISRLISKATWKTIIAVHAGIIITYAAEAVIMITGDLTGRLSPSKPAIVFACGSVLTWVVVISKLDQTFDHVLFRYLIVWVMYVVGEGVLIFEALFSNQPHYWLSRLHIAVQACRLFSFSMLCAIALYNSKECLLTVDEEEACPLLQSNSTQRTDPWSRLEGGLRFSFQYLWPERKPWVGMEFPTIAVVIGLEAVLSVWIPKLFGRIPEELGTAVSSPWVVVRYITFGYIYLQCNKVQGLLWRPLQNGAKKRLHGDCYHHAMRLSMDYHESNNAVDIEDNFKRGTSICDFTQFIFVSIVPNILRLVSTIIFIIYDFGPYLGLIVAGVMVVFLLISGNLISRDTAARDVWHECGLKQRKQLISSLDSWLHHHTHNRIKDEEEKYKNLVHQNLSTGDTQAQWSAIGQAVLSLVLVVGHLGAVFIVFYQAAVEQLTGNILKLISYWAVFGSCVLFFIDQIRGVGNRLRDISRLREMRERQPSVVERADAMQLRVEHGTIEFKDVHFRVLRGISFTCHAGQIVGCVGKNGSGKTTMLRLLARLYDPIRGSIKIDGQDLRQVTVKSLLSSVYFLPSSPPAFNMSVRENLQLCHDGVTEDQIEEVGREVGLDGFFDKTDVSLSDGQRQKLALGKALLRQPKVFLLDEPTRALDNNSQKSFCRTLREKAASGNTVLVVAHRLTTMMDAGLILVFDSGQIVQRGTHQSLIKDEQGPYQRLWDDERSLQASA